MSHERILDRISAAEPHENIVAALEDRLEDAGVITGQDPDALVGSRLFNVATAALNTLRKDPEIKLIQHNLEVPEDSDSLSRFTGRILRQSVKPIFPYEEDIWYKAESLKRVGICNQLEEKFLYSTLLHDYQTDPEQVPNKLFITTLGHLALLEKEEGQPSALLMKPTIIGGIRYPTATAVVIETNPEAKSKLVNGVEVFLINNRTIQAAAPLRFTAFTFSLDERPSVFRPIQGYENNPNIDPKILQQATLAHIKQALPDKDTLKRAAYSLENKTVL